MGAYNVSNYLDPLTFDMSQAGEILMGIYSVRQIQLEEWKKLIETGIEIEILIKEEKLIKHPELLNELNQVGIKVTKLAVNPYSFVLCDEKIIWYGNLRYFMNNDSGASILRLSNKEIAAKMVRQYKVNADN